jgi:flavin reductase (DIM6/NTAB) family NADH-FMN oxidoreductase RutF
MILVSLERSSRTHDLVQASGIFAVTILDASQQEISERFAGRTLVDEDRFIGLDTQTLVSGAPLIRGGLAFLDCRVIASQETGGSTVFFAEVMAASSLPNGNPLAYNDRTYFTLQK